jgi:hypothetical protein
MSNSPDFIISLLQRMDTGKASDALDELSRGQDVRANIGYLENFIRGVSILQDKTVRSIPAVLDKDFFSKQER